MLSQDIWSVDLIQAKIQSKIASLLSCRERLLKIESSTLDLSIGSKAQELLEVQKNLEDELKKALSIIDRINLGAYSISDVINLLSFYYRVDRHISEVSSLERDFQTGPKKENKFSGFEILVMSLIGGGVLYGITRGK